MNTFQHTAVYHLATTKTLRKNYVSISQSTPVRITVGSLVALTLGGAYVGRIQAAVDAHYKNIKCK
jgi:hypothetical protein